ncbi:fungal-specific transcription factor domain-containing protein [Aspergillus californicus]
MSSSGNETSSKPRHRASVACTACRERRTRCVVPPGQTSCAQCHEVGQECIIKNDDQRRKPVSKVYVNQLEEHIQQLENALREKEQQSFQHNQFDATMSDENSSPHEPSATDLPMPSLATPPTPEPIFLKPQPVEAIHTQRRPVLTDNMMTHRLLSTRGHVSFDQLAGQRYFGPTTNCHIYLDTSLAFESEESRRQAREQARRTQRVLSALTQESQDYLLHLFWKHYNSVIRVVDQDAFEAGRETGSSPFYSGFLHVCVLAAGYRFAEKQRPDMQRIALTGRESLLHREAKYMLDYEMERPGGLPSIAALLLLGDLEVGCGRDNAGWLYSGMAYRLCFDVGLHLDRSDCGLSQRDIEIGRMTLWACVIFDRYWALFLGRPTALKPDDLEIYELSQQFDRLGTSPPGSEQSLELQIYQALFELMELAGKIPGIVTTHYTLFSRNTQHDRAVYLRMAALDSELEKWYIRLPESLKYTAENAKTAPPPFFLLHQQYYSTMIMLHRPFAGYDDILNSTAEHKDSTSTPPPAVKHLFALSQTTCTNCAGRIAQIFWQQRQRFDTRRVFVTGLQHAGNAATALVAAIASSKDVVSNDRSMRYLECLVAVLEDLSEAYHPAEQMSTIFKAVLQELRELQPVAQLSQSVIPARRGSSADCDGELEHLGHASEGPVKRGGLNRAQLVSEVQAQAQAQAQAQSMQLQPQQQQAQSMSWLNELSGIMPSPAMTYQSTSEKRGSMSAAVPGRVARQDNNHPQGHSHMATNLDDTWSIFNAPDRPPSPWTGAETPGFFSFANNLAEQSSVNNGFMDLVEEPQGSIADPALIAQKLPATSSSGSGSRMQGYGQGQGHEHRHRPMKRKSPASPREDNIWTEIIS